MPTLTATAITDKQIRDLRAEAVKAGDWRQVDVCNVALGKRPQPTTARVRGMTPAKARATCAKVISYAQGEAAHMGITTRPHATKKTPPAQLEREIAEAFAKKARASR